MCRYRHVVLTVSLGRHPHVAAGLTSHYVAELLQRPSELLPAQIARQPHVRIRRYAAITSSRV